MSGDLDNMNALTINDAYRFLAIAMMLVHVNLFCNKVGLYPGREVKEADMREGGHVGPANTNNFTGSILTDEYFFGFGHGHIANFYKRDFGTLSDADMKKRNIELSLQASLIDTNGAYQLATNWLSKSGVDVLSMERRYKLNLTQRRYYPDGQPGQGLGPSRKEIMLPIYQVEWKGSMVRGTRKLPEGPVVQVVVSGINREMLELPCL